MHRSDGLLEWTQRKLSGAGARSALAFSVGGGPGAGSCWMDGRLCRLASARVVPRSYCSSVGFVVVVVTGRADGELAVGSTIVYTRR